MHDMRHKSWIEAALAVASALLLVITLTRWSWIEEVLGVDPDHGNGSLERLIAALAIGLAVAFCAGVQREWRRAARRRAAPPSRAPLPLGQPEGA
jgi:hypothetical protein